MIYVKICKPSDLFLASDDKKLAQKRASVEKKLENTLFV